MPVPGHRTRRPRRRCRRGAPSPANGPNRPRDRAGRRPASPGADRRIQRCATADCCPASHRRRSPPTRPCARARSLRCGSPAGHATRREPAPARPPGPGAVRLAAYRAPAARRRAAAATASPSAAAPPRRPALRWHGAPTCSASTAPTPPSRSATGPTTRRPATLAHASSTYARRPSNSTPLISTLKIILTSRR